MKKVSKTTTTTPAAPAPIPAKIIAAKPVKKTPPSTKAVAVPVIKAAPPVLKVAPVIKAAPATLASTKIVAKIDVGFGNTLYVRGEGSGLSWEKGVPLDCIADDEWSLSLSETSRPVVFKFLINDLTWSIGEDYAAQPGSAVVFTPAF
jgi:hypothetical protein